MLTTSEIIAGLELAAQRSEDAATQAEVVAAYFRPEFEACWQPPLSGDRNGKLLNAERAVELKFYVIDNEHHAKNLRKEAAAFREAITLIRETLT